MKKLFTIAFILSCLITKANYWTAKSNFPSTGRQLASGFSIGDKGYVTCGLYTAYMNDLWEYDPILDVWTQKADMPGPGRFGASSFTIGGKGYIATGGTSVAFYKDLWEYDPVSNSWAQKANLPGQARQRGAGFSIGKKGYICCGEDLFTYFDDTWEWNQQNNVWTQKAHIPIGRVAPVGFAIGDKGYLCTGYETGPLNDTWQFDPVMNAWNQMADLPAAPRIDASVFVICEKAYLGTGGEAPFYSDLWKFDPSLNRWTQKASLPTASGLDDCFAFAIGTKGYIGLGQPLGSGYTQQVWEYTPDSACAMPVAAHFTSSDTNVCEKQCVDFYDHSTNSPTSWQWLFPGSSTSVSSAQNPPGICYHSAGSYTVTLIACNSLGCDTMTMTNFINQYQTVPVVVIQSNDTLFASLATTYQWYSTDSGIVAGATNSFFVVPNDGGYFVRVTDSVGCNGESNRIIILGNEKINLAGSVIVAPNPFNSNINIRSRVEGELHVNIYDYTSRRIISESFKNSITLNSEILAKGIYIYEIWKSGALVTKGKIVKE